MAGCKRCGARCRGRYCRDCERDERFEDIGERWSDDRDADDEEAEQ